MLIDKLCRGIDSLNRPELAAGMLAYKGGICRTENCSTVPHTSWQPTRRGAGRDARHYGRRGRLPLHRNLEMRRACFFGVLEIGSRKAAKETLVGRNSIAPLTGLLAMAHFSPRLPPLRG